MTCLRLWVLGLVCCCTLAVGAQERRIDLKFENADLVSALRVIARKMQLVLLVGPEVEGSVSAEMYHVQPEVALRRILVLQGRDYTFSRGQRSIIVGSPKTCGWFQSDGCSDKAEFFQVSRPEKVVQRLVEPYPNVRFILRPAWPGFYAAGTKEDLLSIQRQLPQIQWSLPDGQPTTQTFDFKYGEAGADDVIQLLKTLVPEAKCEVLGQQLKVTGTCWAVYQVREFLRDPDE